MKLVSVVAAFGAWGGWPALTALGTVGAVVAAVGLQAWLGWKQRSSRPHLTLHFDSHMRTDESDANTGATLPYLRLAVTNAAGKETARDVEILVLDIEEFATGEVGSGGRHVWLANPALGWANSLDSLPRMSIPPGATRYVDIGRWVGLTPLSFVLSVAPEPASNRHILIPGAWRLRLAATIRNGDASFWEAEVVYAERVEAGLSELIDMKASVRHEATTPRPPDTPPQS